MKNNWFTVKKIRPQLWAIAEFKHFEKTIMYLAVGNAGAVLIDTGMGKYSIHRVVKSITKLPVTIILTHHHWDHVGGLLNSDNVLKAKNNKISKIDSFVIKPIATPGHTPDSFCYYFVHQDWLFVGDTYYPGPLYAHLPESNVHDYTKSLLRLSALTSENTQIFPGHNAWDEKPIKLYKAGMLMKQAIKAKKEGITKLDGNGFSILL